MQEDEEKFIELDIEALQQAIRTTTTDVVTPATLREMLFRMGRNLLEFNKMESILKHVIPYMHPRGAIAGADAFEVVRTELNKETLGKVVKLLVQSMESEDIDAFRICFKQIVTGRNDLIHHFTARFETGTETGCREATVWLDEQYEFCKPFSAMCLTFLTVVLYGLEKNSVAAGNEPLVPAWNERNIP